MTISRAIAVGLVAALLAAVPMACESTKGMFSGSNEYMKMLPDYVQDAAKDYVGDLGDLNKLLSGITDSTKAANATPKAQSLVDKLSGSGGTLNGLTSEMKDTVKKALGDQLGSLTSTFKDQVSRLTGSGGVGQSLKPLLDKVPLFG